MPIRKNNERVPNYGVRRAVSYARVSDKEQVLGFSILAQQALFPPYAAETDLAIEREFSDVHTAKRPGRPGFNAMVEYLRKNPGCKVILVEKTDRLYRNFADMVKAEELDVEIHFVKEHRVLGKDSRAVEMYHHGMEVLNAKRYVDNLSEEVKKGLRTKAEQGLWPSYAPLGYSNQMREEDRRNIIVPDAVLGPVVTSLFAWFYTGEYSLQSLSRRAYEEGFRFRKSGGKVPVSTLQKILRNPIYMGEFIYGGVRYQGGHEPLVRREVWERVQEILTGRNRKKHRKVTHAFVYSGMVGCGHCGCAFVGEVKKGRYVYYHCTEYRGKCGEPYTREETLGREFARGLGELNFPPEVVEWLVAELRDSEKTAEAVHAQALRGYQVELERLQRREEVLYEDRLDGRIDAAAYDNKKAQIEVQREQIRRRMFTAEAALPCPGNQRLDPKQFASQLGERFLEQTSAEQRKLLHAVVQDASWKNGELQIYMREPFESLRLAPRMATGEPPGLTEQGLAAATWPNVLEIRRSSREEDSFSRRESGTTAVAVHSIEEERPRGSRE